MRENFELFDKCRSRGSWLNRIMENRKQPCIRTVEARIRISHCFEEKAASIIDDHHDI